MLVKWTPTNKRVKDGEENQISGLTWRELYEYGYQLNPFMEASGFTALSSGSGGNVLSIAIHLTVDNGVICWS